jgi:signal transduction histidine kinase
VYFINSGSQKLKTYWKKLPLEKRGLIAIFIPLMCLMGSIVTDSLLRQKIGVAQIDVNHTNQVLAKSQNTLVALLNAETGVRGYYISKQPVFLEPFHLAQENLNPTLLDLEQLVQDNPAQLERTQQLTRIAQYKMSLLQETIRRVETNAVDSLSSITARILKGKQSMDEFREIIELFETEERRLLAIRNRSLQTQQQINDGAMWYEIAIGSFGTLLSFRLLKQSALQMTALNISLNETNQSLLQSNRELDQFAYITSHDLKAPLRAISSLAGWIEEDLDGQISTETRSQLDLLRNRVYRMQALLNSLLEYARSGRRHTPITTVDVHLLLTNIIQELAAPDTFSISINSPMPILHTRGQPLAQVFIQLIDNGIRHQTSKQGTVKISAIDQGDRYEFTVADDGEGIAPEFQERIYTIFQTLKARDVQENIGAGLAIVKKIIIAEGGTIQLESSSGNGAIFRFTWLKQPIMKKNITPHYET